MTEKAQAAQLWRPFIVGARDTQRVYYQQNVTLGTAPVVLPSFPIDPVGFIGALYLYVQITGSNAGGAAVALQEDAPFTFFNSITLNDQGSRPIKGAMSGYDWHAYVKHSGFTGVDDETANTGSTYTALTTGAGATAGTGTFCQVIPVCINRRTALGAIVNKNAGSLARLEMTVGTLAQLYSTLPSAGATATVTIVVDGWLDAAKVDTMGNPIYSEPPGGDTTSYVRKHDYAVSAGDFTFRHDPIDGPIRGLVEIFRTTAAGTRAAGETNWPALTTFRYERLDPWSWPSWFWRRKIAEWYGYRGAAAAINCRDNGVYPWPFSGDFGHFVGREQGFGYLPAATNVNITQQGTWGGAGTLSTIVEHIYPGGGDPLVLTGGR